MDAYELHEARFIQHAAVTSAANADSVATPACPEGKIQTILTAGYYPSVAETQTVQFQIYRTGIVLPLTPPVSWAYAAVQCQWPCVTEGMEVKLYPGESLMAVRDAHTVGSTMTLRIRFIESDLPYYSYDEPQHRVAKSPERHSTAFRPSSSSSSSGGSVSRDTLGGAGGKRSQPI